MTGKYHVPTSSKAKDTNSIVNRTTKNAISSVMAGCYSPAAEAAILGEIVGEPQPQTVSDHLSVDEALTRLGIEDVSGPSDKELRQIEANAA